MSQIITKTQMRIRDQIIFANNQNVSPIALEFEPSVVGTQLIIRIPGFGSKGIGKWFLDKIEMYTGKTIFLDCDGVNVC